MKTGWRKSTPPAGRPSCWRRNEHSKGTSFLELEIINQRAARLSLLPLCIPSKPLGRKPPMQVLRERGREREAFLCLQTPCAQHQEQAPLWNGALLAARQMWGGGEPFPNQQSGRGTKAPGAGKLPSRGRALAAEVLAQAAVGEGAREDTPCLDHCWTPPGAGRKGSARWLPSIPT